MRRRTLAPALATVTALLFAPSAEAATIAAVFPNGDPTELTVRIDVDTGAAVTVTWTGTVYDVHDPAGVTPAGDCAAVAGDSTRATCPREPAPDGSFTVAILGGGGDDVLEAGYRSTAFPTGDSIQVFGDAGEDKIGGSPGADFTLSGDDGDDLLDGGGGDDLSVDGRGGADHVYGGPGSDHVGDTESSGDYGDDVIDGGVCPLNTGSFCAGGTAAPGDRDTLDYSIRSYLFGSPGVTIDLRQETGQGEPGNENDTARHVVNVSGTYGNDTITGNAASNDITSGYGNDTINVRDSGKDRVLCSINEFQPYDTVFADLLDEVDDTCADVRRAGPGGGGGGGTTTQPHSPAATLPPGKAASISGRSGWTAAARRSGIVVTRNKIRCAAGSKACVATTGGKLGPISVSAQIVTTSTKRRKRTLKLARYRYKVKAGHAGRLRFKLTRKALRLLKKARRARVRVKVTVRQSGKTTVKRTFKGTVKAPRRKKRARG